MLYQETTKRSLAEIDQRLREAAGRHQFGVLGVHDLKEAMEKKGVPYSGTCLVYEVCNPKQAKEILEKNGAFSTVLPCRISVYESDQGYRLATVLPSALIGLFPDQGLEGVAKEVEEVIVAMMRETAA